MNLRSKSTSKTNFPVLPVSRRKVNTMNKEMEEIMAQLKKLDKLDTIEKKLDGGRECIEIGVESYRIGKEG